MSSPKNKGIGNAESDVALVAMFERTRLLLV